MIIINNTLFVCISTSGICFVRLSLKHTVTTICDDNINKIDTPPIIPKQNNIKPLYNKIEKLIKKNSVKKKIDKKVRKN